MVAENRVDFFLHQSVSLIPHLSWVMWPRAQIRLYIDFELAVLPADGGESSSSPQFEKATIEDLNSLTFTLEVNLRMDLSYVYYS